jgi:hypothetical protein
VQRIDGKVFRRGELLNRFARPVEQRLEFDEVVASVGADQSHIASAGRLFGTQSRNPSLCTSQHTTKWLDFADVTARMPRVAGFVEAVNALALDERGKLALMRIDRPNASAEALFGLSPKIVSLWKGTRRLCYLPPFDCYDVDPGGFSATDPWGTSIRFTIAP